MLRLGDSSGVWLGIPYIFKFPRQQVCGSGTTQNYLPVIGLGSTNDNCFNALSKFENLLLPLDRNVRINCEEFDGAVRSALASSCVLKPEAAPCGLADRMEGGHLVIGCGADCLDDGGLSTAWRCLGLLVIMRIRSEEGVPVGPKGSAAVVDGLVVTKWAEDGMLLGALHLFRHRCSLSYAAQRHRILAGSIAGKPRPLCRCRNV